jgi:hypothetical protein
MKFVLLLFAGLSICALSFAQSGGRDDAALKIKVMPDNVLVTYRSRTTTIGSMALLDSWLKGIVPAIKDQVIDVESTSEIDKDRLCAIQKLLAPYHCPVRSRCVFVRSGQPAQPLKRQLNR